ncbi:serine/alanine racemase [Acetitomaculum ruminis DSM 5522]|uniref:Alanine racemase n=1 Tax=Acetitomaculum ruminis DSM 5522 TaxID=1120918 RepID=A0A1I0ZSB4_9FIRM|nr:serine racemase VanT catalytic subunit [Acetitomaculum ruminis]SFB28699.1 serine/alanine racemase [Acetitomaculum ruminis DSM 5522]
MLKKEKYIAIDYFRIIAALLIVAIHTAPLITYTETGNLILERVIGRLAVPFFFMTTGFFLITRYRKDDSNLINFQKKTAFYYAIAIIIYIPLNIYTGYFKVDNLLPNIIKDTVFDGTMYHLWYLPASIMAASLVWYLLKKFDYQKSFIILLILYILGLMGDSYYNLACKIPVLKSFYDLIFQVSDYTRNGLFFAPVFFLLGGYISDKEKIISLKKSLIGFGIFFTLMLIEALIINNLNLKRHDAMYIFLIPCMWFLFNFLLNFRKKRLKGLGRISLIVYIIHPLMIVFIRLISKITALKILIENSLLFYFEVCVLSIIFALFVDKIRKKLKSENKNRESLKDRAYLEINIKNLKSNVREIKKAMPKKAKLMAVVKANAYGHGDFEIATNLCKMGVSAFAVATIDEAISLRNYGVKGEILILGYTSPLEAKRLSKYDITQSLIDYDYAKKLNEQGYKVKTHLKVDTGMHRLGFSYQDKEKILKAFSMKNLKIDGIFSHLCVADSYEESDVEFTKLQIKRFFEVTNYLKENGQKPKTHIQSSYGFLNYPEIECDYVRAGICLYGVLSSPKDKTKLKLDLKPVLSLRSKIVLTRNIKAGESVGYGRAFVAQQDSKIAVVPLGYGDGYPRNLSFCDNYVLVSGKKAAVIGKICMDQLIIDITDIPMAKCGSIVTLVGKDAGEEIQSVVVADNSETINNEFLCRMGGRLKIV